jgi:signal-transduction protein with cAMP-binding, CBS, and nucleotidyltransferase domain
MTDREQRTLQGVITGRDICIHVVAEALSSTETPLSEVMTRPPVVCRSGSTVEHAMRIMKTLRLRRLPVVDDKGRLIGVVKLEQVLGQGLVGSSDMCRDLTEAFATSRGANLCLTGRGGLPFASRV